MQAEFSHDPQISIKATQHFKEEGPLIIKEIDGKYQNFNFSEYANDVTVKQIEGIQIKGWYSKWNYTGMVNKDNKPHGFGRVIRRDNYGFIDGQWKDGMPHGYSRQIY